MKTYKLHYIALLIVCAISLVGCNDSDSFDNKTFINSALKNDVLIQRGITKAERSLQAAIAYPEKVDVKIRYKADPSLVGEYKRLYGEDAKILPAEYYTLVQPEAVIKAGSVLSSQAKIEFDKLDMLDSDSIYVLPVSIENVSQVGILTSKQTSYFVVKGAALINTVADIESNFLSVNWAKPEVCNNLSELTIEALFRARDYKRLISTVMGIEGKFLIRIGDANFPSNQIQIATSAGNYPQADSRLGLPVNEWVHIALTYNSKINEMRLFVNGKEQFKATTQGLGKINLGVGGVDGFYIGRSYADERFLAGEIAECRIWNVVRGENEIIDNPYYVDPASPGLVAYWKFSDGDGNLVKDHTSNSNHAVAKRALKWTSVSLPEKDK